MTDKPFDQRQKENLTKKKKKNRISAVTTIKLINDNADVLIALNGNGLLSFRLFIKANCGCILGIKRIIDEIIRISVK